MGRYCMGTAEDIEDILDLANMVFSMSHGAIDFSRLLPKAYSKGRYEVLRHHMIKEGDRIRALVDLYPVTLRSGCDLLEAAYVGTVSVHPGSRGKGYMTELMARAEQDARERGCALMILDGNRHRYQHFGFERAGIRYVFQVRMRNISHCCDQLYGTSRMGAPAYSFEEVGEDSPYIEDIFGLYARRNVTARTQADMMLCLESSQAVTYAVLQEGAVAGYFELSEDGKNVLEFEMDEISELPRAAYDLMMGLELSELGFAVGMDETEKIDWLDKMSDLYHAALSHQIKILDHEKALRFLLGWKRMYGAPATGRYVVGLEDPDGGCRRRYQMSVREDGISVSLTPDAPDVVLGEMELVRLLTTSSFFADQQKGSGRKIKNAPAGWFPLPFYLPDADAF